MGCRVMVHIFPLRQSLVLEGIGRGTLYPVTWDQEEVNFTIRPQQWHGSASPLSKLRGKPARSTDTDGIDLAGNQNLL